MMIVKKFGVLSVASIYGILSAIVGLIIGLFYGAILTALSGTYGALDPIFPGIEFLGVGAVWVVLIIISIIFYGIIGFLSGLIGAALYNVFAKWIGGIKVELLTGSDVGS